MVRHLSIVVADFALSTVFYEGCLTPLGKRGKDNGAPGSRMNWENFYSAFVLIREQVNE